MSEPGVHVVRAQGLTDVTSQTSGMVRRAGIDPSISRGLWVGRVSTGPGFSSGAHHHGEAETVGHVLTGRARIRFGDDFNEYVDLVAGDFVYIGPYVPHIEENLDDDGMLEFVTVRSPDNIVVNLGEAP